MSDTAKVDFWFDPMCPWCWMTSRWIKDVEKVRDVEVTWHPFSLSILNEGRDLPESYQKHMDEAWGPARVVAAVYDQYDQAKLDELYTALGEEIHHRKNNKDSYTDAIEKALKAVGLPAELAEFATSGKFDEQLRASNKAGLDAAGGDDIGVPLMSINGVTFFGPVMSPAPTGEEAGKVFDGALALASYPGFFEIKRPRNVGPIFNTEK
ncbi:DsbA family protein [uncultured Rothia sp.]|uniref:DsbA family oxidoreductase n=1 Tax=uncultured Rothia sp. TaxID=316088 RepID=UPI0032166603